MFYTINFDSNYLSYLVSWCSAGGQIENEDLKYYKLSVKNIIFSSFFVFFMPLDPDPDPDSNPDPDPDPQT